MHYRLTLPVDLKRFLQGATQRADQAVAQVNQLRQIVVCRFISYSHVCLIDLCQGKLRQELQAAQTARAADAERATAERQAAVDKIKEELQTSTQSTEPTEDIVKRHAAELRALEERLSKQHQDELKRAVESAREAAPKADGESNQQAIDAAVAARVAELKAQQEEELTAAVERGRMESATKSKLKDAQLVRTQGRLKELEAQLEEAKKAGFTPSQPAAAGSTSSAKPKPSEAPATAAQKPGPSKLAPAASSGPVHPAGSAALPAKPGAPGGGAIRTRGAPRGRGGAPAGISIRGAAPAAANASTQPATTNAQTGNAAAAAKRTREEGEGTEDGSLAKRLKPEGASKPPVRLQRDRVAPPS